MISIDFHLKNKEKISISFLKEKIDKKIKILKKISEIFLDYPELKFYIQINGIGFTIEKIIKEIKSDNYIFIDKYSNKFIYKEYAQFQLLTEYKDDYNLIINCLESFNEGTVKIDLINLEKFYIKDESFYNNILQKNTFLSIEIHSDAEVFDICSNNCNNLMLICSSISKFLIE